MNTPRRRHPMKIPALTALLAGSAIVLAACGGTSSGTAADTTTSGGAGSTSPASGPGLHVASTSLGKVLVDQKGMTVYLLTADGRDQSTCGSDCLKFWPAATPGHSTLSVPVSTTKTPAGTPTATVAGQPVYTFSLDHAPGDVNGEGISEFGGTWYAVSATGQAVTAASGSASSSPSTSGGSAPYGGGGY
jgi:predicted lipoprotein with Yx(FWY)xxD motif